MTTPRWPRLASSLGLLTALAGGCTYYLARTVRGDLDTSVIAYLDHVAPVWPTLLGLGALGIVLGLCVPRAAVVGHSLAVGVLVAYSAALWWGALVGTAGWVTAAFALALAIHASVLTHLYAQDPQWTRH